MGAQFGLELEIITLLYLASALGGPAFFVAINASIKKLRKKSKEGDFSGTTPRSVQSLSVSFALEAETLWPRIEAEKTAVGKQLGLGAAPKAAACRL